MDTDSPSRCPEILANVGYDWIAIDGEHSGIPIDRMTDLFHAMHGRGAVPLVRVRENDTLTISEALDFGAHGVIVPLINSAEEAAKYPPDGVRGYCYSRMNNCGVDFDVYAQRANDQVLVIVMIESAAAVENIDDILAVDGVDGVFIGPYDLSGSYGIPGQIDHPRIVRGPSTRVGGLSTGQQGAGLPHCSWHGRGYRHRLMAGI